MCPLRIMAIYEAGLYDHWLEMTGFTSQGSEGNTREMGTGDALKFAALRGVCFLYGFGLIVACFVLAFEAIFFSGLNHQDWTDNRYPSPRRGYRRRLDIHEVLLLFTGERLPDW